MDIKPLLKKLKNKKTKKNIKTAIIIISISIVIILVLLAFLGIKVKFVLGNELNIDLKPLEANLFIANDESANITFDVKNDNFPQCRSICEFSLHNLKDNPVLFSLNKSMGHKEEFSQSFVLYPPKKGSGQFIYVFEANCRNVKSLICLTEEKYKYKSSIVTLNYELTDEEKRIKEGLLSKLSSVTDSLNLIFFEKDKNNILFEKIDDLTDEKSSLTQDNNAIDEYIKKTVDISKNFLNLWISEDYLSLNDALNAKIFEDISAINSSITNIRDSIIEIINMKNDNVALLQQIESEKENISEITYFYESEINNNNFNNLKDINSTAGGILDIYSTLKLKKQHSEKDLNLKLNEEDKKVSEQIQQFNNISDQARFIGVFGSALMSEKNSSLQIIVPDVQFCNQLRNFSSSMEILNNYSILFRDDKYNWSINNSEFDLIMDNVSKRIVYDALIDSFNFINASSLGQKENLLKIIDEKISSISSYSNISIDEVNFSLVNKDNISEVYNFIVPIKDLYGMTILNNEEIDLFMKNNCKDSFFDSNISLNGFEDFFSANLSSLEKTVFEIIEPKINILFKVDDNPAVCCAFSSCRPCGVNKSVHPVIFIHGHEIEGTNSPENTMNDFTRIQEKMQKEGFVNAGQLDLNEGQDENVKGIWGIDGYPVTVRASFYYIQNYKLGRYSVDVQKSERIENYAIRLKEMIDLLKFKTGADKVDIIALSMGGLVARDYVSLFGDDDIDKIITINTPNHGITKKIEGFCSFLGSSKECDDMSEGSIFLNRLNSLKVPDNLYVIRSVGCKMEDTVGDGIVTNESAYLEGAKNFLIKGKCDDPLGVDLHGQALDPSLHPETYNIIINILKE